ncbi:MAG: AMP-binding protein [Chloroflexota bacterium]
MHRFFSPDDYAAIWDSERTARTGSRGLNACWRTGCADFFAEARERRRARASQGIRGGGPPGGGRPPGPVAAETMRICHEVTGLGPRRGTAARRRRRRRAWVRVTTMAGETLGQHRCDRLAGRLPAMEDVEASIGERFAAQVEAHGPCLAVRDRVSSVTYADLGAWAGGVAARLADVGVRPGARVVLLLDQGAPAIAATLGTLLAGAAYVPLDPIEPDARLRALLDRVRPGAFLTDDAGSARLARLGVGAPVLSASERTDPGDHRPPAMDPGAPASIFFTSGTTGAPKGVVDCHRNILHNAFRYVTTTGHRPGRPAHAGAAAVIQAPMSARSRRCSSRRRCCPTAWTPPACPRSSRGCAPSGRRSTTPSRPSCIARSRSGDLPDVQVLRLEGDPLLRR